MYNMDKQLVPVIVLLNSVQISSPKPAYMQCAPHQPTGRNMMCHEFHRVVFRAKWMKQSKGFERHDNWGGDE